MGCGKGTDNVVGGSSNGSLCDEVELDKDGEKAVTGIAGSPGAVNISTSEIDPVITSHEFSMSMNECWMLGAMPGSPVMFALTLLPGPKSKVASLAGWNE